MGKDVIVACDFASAAETFRFLDQFTEEKPYVKIGMELYYAEGPQIVREIKARGHRIFLDLKLHDIPNTVKKAMKVLSGLDVDMCNLHAAAFDRGYAADLHRPETYGRGPLDRKATGAGGRSLCSQRQKGGTGRRGLLTAGGGTRA